MSKENRTFSFVITNYNYETYLVQALESVVNQDYDKELYEIVCVDDGSTDGSMNVINQFSQRHPHFKFFHIQNSGLEKACNMGIKNATHEYVIRVDSDDMVGPALLTKMNQAMNGSPAFDFYYCKNYVEYTSDKEQISKSVPEFDKEEIFRRGDFFATGTVYRKKDLADVGYFPESVKNCGLENYSVILALLTKGKKGLAVPGASFSYRRHHTNMSVVKTQAIIDFGKNLLQRYGRLYQTNEFHPYGLKLTPEGKPV